MDIRRLTWGCDSRQNEVGQERCDQAFCRVKMSAPPKTIWILVLAGALLVSIAAIAQDTGKKSSPETTPTATHPGDVSKTPQKKISLTDVTPVSTEETARRAAHEAATAETKGKDATTDGSVESVTEFRPAPPDTDSAKHSDSKASTKHSKKNIHGEAYGSLAPANSGTRQSGATVGTTSKSGKTSVYVDANQARSTTPPPH